MKKEVLHINKVIFQHRLLFIILAAILTTVVLAVLSNLAWFIWGTPNSITVTDQNGSYNLSGINILDDTVIKLAPGSAYYPNTYLVPENAESAIPESTDSFDEIRADYLSQRFVIKIPDDDTVYAMTFSLSGRHAMRVYVNGKLTVQTGQPGTTKQSTEVWENNISFYAAAQDGKIDIILHSAQFYHAKRGASLAELNLSKTQASFDLFFSDRIKGMANMGALLCAAILLLGIFLMLSRTWATLYFALACIAMALRECLQSQAWTYFKIPGNLSFMLEYLSMVLLTVFLTLYLTKYASGKFLRIVQYTSLIGSCIYGLCLLGDSIFYTSVLKYYQYLLIACIVPGISVLIWKMRRPTKEQGAAIYGIVVFFLAALSDIVMYSDIFGDQANIPISEVAMLVFVLAQTVSLFQMNNRVLGEAKAAEQKLEIEKTALESLNRLKTEFLGNVSHELKTPLTVVSGHAQLICSQLAGPEYAAIRDKSRIISSEADRLALMVGQVLDVTRIEEKKILLEKRLCHIDELIYQAVETHFPILNKGGNRLEINVGLDLPKVNADPGRITQVLVNVVTNALHHTKQGIITISAKEVDETMEISVSDTGKGIPEGELPKLFTRYRSGSGGAGTGLGLYICKYLVEEHGGAIRVESTVGKGTTVTFSLPL